MGTQQVSIWVPIVVGIIGVIGIASGQLINSWREDRRWQREKDREELRWQREVHKEADARAEANRTHWRDKKFEVYTEFLSFLKHWGDLLEKATNLEETTKELPEEFMSSLQRFVDECLDQVDKITLLATNNDARETMVEALDVYDSYALRLLFRNLPISNADLPNTARITNSVIAAIRVDLGIAHNQDEPSSSPAKRD